MSECTHCCPQHCPPQTSIYEAKLRGVYISDEKRIDRNAFITKTERPFMLHEHKIGDACNNSCKFYTKE